MPDFSIPTRQAAERAVCRAAFEALVAEGFHLRIAQTDGGDGAYTQDIDLLVSFLGACDEQIVKVRRLGETPVYRLYLIHGNTGYDVLADYSSALTPWADSPPVVAVMNEWVEKIHG